MRKGAAEPPSKGLQERQEGFGAGSQSRDAKRHPKEPRSRLQKDCRRVRRVSGRARRAGMPNVTQGMH